MQMVINIDDKMYEAILDGWWPDTTISVKQLLKKGTPLPKGHGDLIDRACLYDFRDWLNTCPKDCDEDDEVWFTSTEVINKIKQYSAVIDADKTESEL